MFSMFLPCNFQNFSGIKFSMALHLSTTNPSVGNWHEPKLTILLETLFWNDDCILTVWNLVKTAPVKLKGYYIQHTCLYNKVVYHSFYNWLSVPILKSNSCLISTALLVCSSGTPKLLRALLTDCAVISENFARYIFIFLWMFLQTSIISKPIFSPSLSQSVHIIRPSHPLISLCRVS